MPSQRCDLRAGRHAHDERRRRRRRGAGRPRRGRRARRLKCARRLKRLQVAQRVVAAQHDVAAAAAVAAVGAALGHVGLAAEATGSRRRRAPRAHVDAAPCRRASRRGNGRRGMADSTRLPHHRRLHRHRRRHRPPRRRGRLPRSCSPRARRTSSRRSRASSAATSARSPSRCDVTEWERRSRRSSQRALDAFGRIDVAFANAGFGGPRGFRGDDPEHWRAMVLTNVYGAALHDPRDDAGAQRDAGATCC